MLVMSACSDDSGSGSGEASGGGESGRGSVTLMLTEDGCAPVSLGAAAGDVEFVVTNDSG